MMQFIIVLLQFCALSMTTWASSPLKIVMWHSLSGSTGEAVKQLVDGFNSSQQDYIIKPIYKGEYADSLTSFAAAFRAKQPPAIIQVFEVGTAIMLSPQGVIKLFNELIQEQAVQLPISDFLPAIRAFYGSSGYLQAMPFNISIPVVYYNADALAKVGIVNSASFPKTWDEMEVLAVRLKQAGIDCAYTSSYPAWIQIESFSALHGLPMLDNTKGNTKVIYNNQAIIHHLKRLREWQVNNYFEYGGRASDATILFTSGHCAMFSESSGSYNSLATLVKFRLGVAALPLDESVSKIRHNNVVGGAALWTVAGQSADTYRGVALFYHYIAKCKVQDSWQKSTGYIPLGVSGTYLSLARANNSSPILAIAKFDLGNFKDTLYQPSGIPQNQIRAINDEALEAIFAGIKSPSDAINDAVTRANFALMRFARNTM